jgi:hypothetical protein
MKKYKLTEELTTENGKTLYRIKALRSFNDVKKGDLGGFVESEHNLDHDGNCWIYNNASVSDKSVVYDNACVRDNARVFGKVHIFENAQISGIALLSGQIKVSGDAHITGQSMLVGANYLEDIIVTDCVEISGRTVVYGQPIFRGDAKIYNNNSYRSFYINRNKDWLTYTFSNRRWCWSCKLFSTEEFIEYIRKEYNKKDQEYFQLHIDFIKKLDLMLCD